MCVRRCCIKNTKHYRLAAHGSSCEFFDLSHDEHGIMATISLVSRTEMVQQQLPCANLTKTKNGTIKPISLAVGCNLFTTGENVRFAQHVQLTQTGRASCRERVCKYG